MIKEFLFIERTASEGSLRVTVYDLPSSGKVIALESDKSIQILTQEQTLQFIEAVEKIKEHVNGKAS